MRPVKAKAQTTYLMLLPLQGAFYDNLIYCLLRILR